MSGQSSSRDQTWRKFDQSAAEALPFLGEAISIAADLYFMQERIPRRIVDLGVGPGLSGSMLLRKFPTATFIGIDSSPDSLALAESRLRPISSRVSLLQLNLQEGLASLELGTADLVFSSFCLHHLTDDSKKRLFSDVASLLGDTDWFIILDVVAPIRPTTDVLISQLRAQSLRRNGLTWKWINENYFRHRETEMPAPAESQLRWLCEAGLAETTLLFQYLDVALFCARRRPTIAPHDRSSCEG